MKQVCGFTRILLIRAAPRYPRSIGSKLMAHVGAKQILSKARQAGHGVPCLLAGNLEMLIGAVQAAEELGAPLILAYNAQVTPQIPMSLIAPAMVKAAESARVPVATILDHGADLLSVEQAIACSFSTVMFDGSSLPFEENVRRTQEVVHIAHAHSMERRLPNLQNA